MFTGAMFTLYITFICVIIWEDLQEFNLWLRGIRHEKHNSLDRSLVIIPSSDLTTPLNNHVEDSNSSVQ